jgi:rod shape-determining protein MreD
MSTTLMLALAFACVVLDISFAPGATLLGGRAQLTLVVVALWAALRPEAEVMLLAPVAGVLLGLLGNEPLGLSLIAFTPVVWLGATHEERSTEGRFAFTIGLVAIASLVYVVAAVVIAQVAGDPVPLRLGSLRTIAIVTALNLGLAAVLYWPLARTAGEPGARPEPRRS